MAPLRKKMIEAMQLKGSADTSIQHGTSDIQRPRWRQREDREIADRIMEKKRARKNRREGSRSKSSAAWGDGRAWELPLLVRASPVRNRDEKQEHGCVPLVRQLHCRTNMMCS